MYLVPVTFKYVSVFSDSSSSFCSADNLAYEVRWFFTRLRGGETTAQVASVDRFGVVRKDTRNSSSDLSVERKDTHTYILSVHGTQDRWVSSTRLSRRRCRLESESKALVVVVSEHGTKFEVLLLVLRMLKKSS